MVRARQAVITEPFKTTVREVELPDPSPNQILIAAEYSAISAGTELAVYTGTHQWLKDPALPDWKFPFRAGYSAAGIVLAVGKSVTGVKPGDRVSYPGNHASAELLTLGHERGRVWQLPAELAVDAQFQARFEREARVLARLSHPHVVKSKKAVEVFNASGQAATHSAIQCFGAVVVEQVL